MAALSVVEVAELLLLLLLLLLLSLAVIPLLSLAVVQVESVLPCIDPAAAVVVAALSVDIAAFAALLSICRALSRSFSTCQRAVRQFLRFSSKGRRSRGWSCGYLSVVYDCSGIWCLSECWLQSSTYQEEVLVWIQRHRGELCGHVESFKFVEV